jgi:hypothetical protein
MGWVISSAATVILGFHQLVNWIISRNERSLCTRLVIRSAATMILGFYWPVNWIITGEERRSGSSMWGIVIIAEIKTLPAGSARWHDMRALFWHRVRLANQRN